MKESEDSSRFEAAILPHLDAAYTLARWLARNPDDARDIVQESLVRALKYFSGYRGGNSRSWLLTIVRNTGYRWLERRGPVGSEMPADEDLPAAALDPSDPELSMMRKARHRRVHEAVRDLPIEFRETIILRELEGLTYKEISDVAGVPLGTVMSRLTRARQRLKESLSELRSAL